MIMLNIINLKIFILIEINYFYPVIIIYNKIFEYYFPEILSLILSFQLYFKIRVYISYNK